MKRTAATLVSILLPLSVIACSRSPATSSNSAPPPATTAISSQPATGTATTSPAGSRLQFTTTGWTEYGEWTSDITVAPAAWKPGDTVNATAKLRVTTSHMGGLAGLGLLPEGLCVLVTAERTFDADGVLRLGSDERMSTILTPSGLAIEGGVQGAVTDRYGYGFKTPVDEFKVVRFSDMPKADGYREAVFTISAKLPVDLPPGIYRVRLDYGVLSAKRYYSLNGETFAYRPFFKGRPTESDVYSPPIRASGKHVSGRDIDASKIEPRVPWVILANYNSNGSRGAVAEEDKDHFALSNRNLIPDDTILPLYDERGNKLSYSLEPQFPTDTIELRSNIPWDYTKGQMSVLVTGPDGKTAELGTAPFVGQLGQWPTTKKPAITAWKPPSYGYYTVKVTGWTEDIWGNRYEGGGTYHFWIAKRMTLATATFQGMSYPVGTRYGRDLAFAPAVPADVEVHAYLYVNSDPKNVKSITYSGKASPSGIFGAAQGSVPFVLDAPGEYFATILAKYTDREGNLWVESLRHAGVVYPDNSPIVAHGKKLTATGGKLVDRGDTNFEGYVDADNVSHLAHINYPFQSGDVLEIASEGQGCNKIEPVLTYETKVNPTTYDPKLQTIGATNLKLQTSNKYSPHLFPEYITNVGYYYSAAPRPGFMSRFLVAEDGTRAPYWPTSSNNFGGQIGASNNGDMPGVIYRFVGGVVVKNERQTPAYAGYLASGFIMPPRSNDNRVVVAGSEDLLNSVGTKGRFFLVGTRIGMTYEAGTAFVPVAQVDPIVPAVVTFTIRYPDGRVATTQGTSDNTGSVAGRDRFTLDIPGVYKFYLEGDWRGEKGYMPGLPATGGDIYVIEKDRPADLWGPKLNAKSQFSFDATKGFTVTGNSTSDTVYFAAVIPGAVILQGSVPVVSGKFQYTFDPAAVNKAAPVYDIVNRVSGKAEIGAVVHLTFFSKETASDGKMYYTFTRLIVRGTTVLNVR